MLLKTAIFNSQKSKIDFTNQNYWSAKQYLSYNNINNFFLVNLSLF